MAFNNASLGYVHAMRTSWAVSTTCHTVYVTPFAAHVQVFNSKVAAARLRDCAAEWA